MPSKEPGGSGLLDPEYILDIELGLFPGATVADLGCGGAAYFTLQAARIVGDEGVVYAVDVLKEILSNVEVRAKIAGLTNVRTLWSNIEKYGATKINDSKMDFSFLVSVLFQNTDHGSIIKEAARITKTGGKILVIDWKEGRFPMGPEPQHKVAPDRVRELSESVGLKEKKTFSAGQFHYGIVLEKIV